MGGKSKAATANVITIAVIIGLALLFFLWWNPSSGEQPPENTWNIDVSVSPFLSSSVSPSGIVYVPAGEGLTVNASSTSEWTFSHWLLDDVDAGATPSLFVGSKLINSSHTLVAVFVAHVPTFEISPSKTFVKGIAPSDFFLTLQNNGDFDISEIHLKLNDPYGVFSDITVQYGWKQGQSQGGTNPQFYWHRSSNSALNKYSPIVLLDAFSESSPQKFNLSAHSSAIFYIAQDYYGGTTTINPNIEGGTYHLTWSVQFTVTSGNFTGVPLLTVSWDVTILG